jgi:hypothetical protein
MKQRQIDGGERRRPSVDLNLTGESKALVKTPKGLLAFVKRLLAGRR